MTLQHQLFLNPAKCTFALEKVEFLGHMIGHGQTKIEHKKVVIIDD